MKVVNRNKIMRDKVFKQLIRNIKNSPAILIENPTTDEIKIKVREVTSSTVDFDKIDLIGYGSLNNAEDIRWFKNLVPHTGNDVILFGVLSEESEEESDNGRYVFINGASPTGEILASFKVPEEK